MKLVLTRKLLPLLLAIERWRKSHYWGAYFGPNYQFKVRLGYTARPHLKGEKGLLRLMGLYL